MYQATICLRGLNGELQPMAEAEVKSGLKTEVQRVKGFRQSGDRDISVIFWLSGISNL